MQSYENADKKLFFSFVKAKTWTFITKKRRNALLLCTPSLLIFCSFAFCASAEW